MEEQKKTEKRSYEDLEKENMLLSQRLREAYARLNDADMSMVMTRLNFLFKVIDSYAVFDPQFVDMCTKEIQKMLFGPEDSNQKSEE